MLVDIGAVALSLRSTDRTDQARDTVTAMLSYSQNLSGVVEATLDAETGQRGYLLTGDRGYLVPTRAAIDRVPGLLADLRREGGQGAELLQEDATLAGLVHARLADIERTVALVSAGHRARALAIVRTNRGDRLTQDIRRLGGQMATVALRRLQGARRSARTWQAWAMRAGFVAYGASGLLLLVLITLVREYLVTEHARRASREAQLDAERLSTARSLFLSRVSHELRTPLSGILGFGQLLEREPLGQGQRETLEHMLAGARHLLGIVDDLLDLSRVEAGGLRLSLEPVALKDAIVEARSLVSTAAVAAAVGIRLRPMSEDLHVTADRQRLLQVLLNLLSNAVKYNRRGGNVVISASSKGGLVRVEVTDSGFGISKESLERLATPFERLDAARHGIEGTGLGLAVARGLVEAMGGKLGLRSEEGVGTTAWIELTAAVAPIDTVTGAGIFDATRSKTSDATRSKTRVETHAEIRDAAAARRARADPEGARHPPTSVLYIEDNASIARLVERIFALAPELSLTVAGDGTAGLAMARELRPDLILLDLQLPDMSGEQVLAALLADPVTQAIPVLVVSAEAAPVQARRLRAAGAVGYLTKPFEVDELLAAVRARGGISASQGVEPPDELLDRAMVRSLHNLAANPAVGPEQLGNMLATFRQDAAGALLTLQAGVAQGDLTAVAREAHRLAGGAGAVGARRFHLLCRALEHAARQKLEAEARQLDDQLGPAMEQTWEAIRVEFASELAGVSSVPELQSETVDTGERTGAER